MNKKQTLPFFVTFFVCLCIYNCFEVACYGEPKRNKLLPINVAGIELEIELAVTPEEHIWGLMYRDKLEDNGGMLFVFPKEEILSFWMKDTCIPLSIAFIKANGQIVQIELMKPYSLDAHVSREPVKYALEMKDGWFKIHNVKEGNAVKIPLVTAEKGRD